MMEINETHGVEWRRSPRRSLSTRVRIVVLSRDAIWGEGYAVVRNISPGGVMISDLQLVQSLPAEPFKLALVIEDGALKGLQATCRVRRISSNNGTLALGLEFERIPEKQMDLIRRFVSLPFRSKRGD